MINAEPLEYCSPGKSGDHGVLFNIGVHWRRGAFADVGVKSETMIEYFQRERQSACGDYDVHRPGDAMDWLNGGEATVALESPSGDEELNVVGKDLSRCRSIARCKKLTDGTLEPEPPRHEPPPIRNQHGATARRSTSVSNKQPRSPTIAPEVNRVPRSLPTVALTPLDQALAPRDMATPPPPVPRPVVIADPPVICRWQLVVVDPAHVAAEPVVARPRWVCCSHGDRDPNMDMWYDVLRDQFDCDASSIMDLMALAQKDRRGYDMANSIIHKMFKKINDQVDWTSSASAFLASNVKDARHKLHPEGKRYAGMSSRAKSVDPRGFDAEF